MLAAFKFLHLMPCTIKIDSLLDGAWTSALNELFLVQTIGGDLTITFVPFPP